MARRRVRSVACAVLLSYAPVLKWYAWGPHMGPQNPGWIDGSRLPAYKPVDWLIDHTPAGRPLFLWADAWGVRHEFVWARLSRNRNR